MSNADAIREGQRAAWAGLAPSWEKWDSSIQDQLAPVGLAIIEHLDLRDDQVHLDIASGTGEPGLSIARRAPRGRVVLTDLSPEMLAVATRRARAAGITNIETRVCSADDLPFEDASFDSISVRFGFMFFPDLPAATAELVRVLRPGGRLCAAVWAAPEANPWTQIAAQAVASEIEVIPPTPDEPSMFRCAAPGVVSGLFEGAGLHEVAEWDVPVEMAAPSPEDAWHRISEHVSLVAAALQRVDEPGRERMRSTVIAALQPYECDGVVRVPGLARCIVGTKPPSR